MTVVERAPLFDPAAPAVVADPYPAYAALRDAGPAWRSPAGFWIVARHADVTRLLRERRLSSSQPGGEPGAPVGALAEHGRWVMVASDPPDHARRRGAVQPEFASAAIASIAPAIEHHVAARLDALDALQGSSTDLGPAGPRVVDLVEAVTAHVPVLTITALLGLPSADATRIRTWTADFTDGLEPWGDAAAEERAGAALDAMTAYLSPHLAARSADPGDDLLSVLTASEDLSADEKLQNGLLLLNAGLDTSSDLLANLLAELAVRPDDWTRLRDDPDRWVHAAVEEGMRHESPVQFTMRRTIEPVELDGVTIPAAEPVLLAVGSANRDPAAFADPDSFDLDRFDRDPKLRQVGFGGGAHLCLGAPLARLEAVAVLRAMVARYSSISLTAPAPWRPRVFFRGRAAVPVHLTRT